ncbi:MAG: hypothetical protein PHW04_07375 [Candidatus Wallbacteria bacterium]|nr:hypothetical protein [Candidatus Wallbacteria bacterium]
MEVGENICENKEDDQQIDDCQPYFHLVFGWNIPIVAKEYKCGEKSDCQDKIFRGTAFRQGLNYGILVLGRNQSADCEHWKGQAVDDQQVKQPEAESDQFPEDGLSLPDNLRDSFYVTLIQYVNLAVIQVSGLHSSGQG